MKQKNKIMNIAFITSLLFMTGCDDDKPSSLLAPQTKTSLVGTWSRDFKVETDLDDKAVVSVMNYRHTLNKDSTSETIRRFVSMSMNGADVSKIVPTPEPKIDKGKWKIRGDTLVVESNDKYFLYGSYVLNGNSLKVIHEKQEQIFNRVK